MARIDRPTIFMSGRRSGYAPDSCGKTMTLGELIEHLQELAEDYDALDAPVIITNDGGYTYGNIDLDSFFYEEPEDGEEEDW